MKNLVETKYSDKIDVEIFEENNTFVCVPIYPGGVRGRESAPVSSLSEAREKSRNIINSIGLLNG